MCERRRTRHALQFSTLRIGERKRRGGDDWHRHILPCYLDDRPLEGSGPCGKLSGADDEHPTGYGGAGLTPEVLHTVHQRSAPSPPNYYDYLSTPPDSF